MPLIEYDRNNWWRNCLAFRGTVIPRVIGRVGEVTFSSLIVCLVDHYFLEHFGIGLPQLDQFWVSVLGIAISLFIVFRTQSSHARYWEARTLWGSLVNNCRSLVRTGAVHAGPADELARLVAAYVLAIKQNLRDSADLSELKPLLSGLLFDKLAAARNPPTALARSLSEWIARRQKEGRIDSITAMTMEHVVTDLVAAQGGCERIHQTPLPFVYAALIKQLLLVYLLALPFVLVATLNYAAPLAVAVVAFAMLGIEEAGVEIEDPFGLESNHLPLDRICEGIARDAAQVAKDYQS
jgi:putative membrane protein